MTFTFPQGFTWGVATASYQVEGAAQEGGRTPSIWDTYCAVPGNISDGSSGEVACDEYHRYKEDVALMKKLGVKAYRFSVSWSRVFPSLDGPVNEEGINYYRSLISELVKAGIKPVVTLYHWDLPQYLQDIGGWANREVAYRFADYARELARQFGSSVDTWTTLNEPWCAAYLGYGSGIHAPGIANYAQALAAVHHLNLAHGLAIKAIREELGEQAKCSVTLNLQIRNAASHSADDRLAEHMQNLLDNEVFLGPMLEGAYDPEIFELTRDWTDWSFVKPGDVEIIHQPINSLGVNYYSASTVYLKRLPITEKMAYRRHLAELAAKAMKPAEGEDAAGLAALSASGSLSNAGGVPVPQGAADRVQQPPVPGLEDVAYLPGEGELTDTGWSQNPEELTKLLFDLHRRFPSLPLMITENGSAWKDEVSVEPDGTKIVHDPKRVAYLNDHVKAMADAIEAGVPVIGYYAWSLLDNFEWGSGYSKRFGIIRVDYDTQERIWKDSATRYSEIAHSNQI